jgi:hypothetical protein
MQIWRNLLVLALFIKPVEMTGGHCTQGSYGRIELPDGTEVICYVGWNELHMLWMQFVEYSASKIHIHRKDA